MEIPVNKTKTENIDRNIDYILSNLTDTNVVSLYRDNINKAEAEIIARRFKENGYYHEIRMHSNNYGNVFFYCLNISRQPVRSKDARFAWSEFV